MAKRSESRMLETTGEVMDALGGVGAVSALTGARYKTVWPWADGKTFPSRYFLVMTWALKRKRLTAPPSLWGQVMTAEMEKAAA
jgi:hypothetical protein